MDDIDWNLPPLRLHDVHRKGVTLAGAPSPVVESDALAALGNVDGRGCNSPAERGQPASTRSLTVRLSGQKLMGGAAREESDGKFEIPLLLTQVRLCVDCRIDCPVIAVSAHSSTDMEAAEDDAECTAWLILVDGDLPAAHRTLDAFGAAGGIRADIEDNYRLIPKPLGSGANAVVYPAFDKRAGKQVVAKILNPDPETLAGEMSKSLRREVAMLSAAQRHANIVKLFGVYTMDTEDDSDASPDTEPQSQRRWVILMERCSGGDLFDAVSKHLFSESRARKAAKDILTGLHHLHELRIVHRDVKVENVLLARNGRAVLADLGIACLLTEVGEMKRRCGSPGYVAPEILCGTSYNEKVDIFSCGAILYYCFCGKPPFEGPDIGTVLRKTVQCTVTFKQPRFSQVSLTTKGLIRDLLTRAPEERPSAIQALEDTWFKEEELDDPGGGGDSECERHTFCGAERRMPKSVRSCRAPMPPPALMPPDEEPAVPSPAPRLTASQFSSSPVNSVLPQRQLRTAACNLPQIGILRRNVQQLPMPAGVSPKVPLPRQQPIRVRRMGGFGIPIPAPSNVNELAEKEKCADSAQPPIPSDQPTPATEVPALRRPSVTAEATNSAQQPVAPPKPVPPSSDQPRVSFRDSFRKRVRRFFSADMKTADAPNARYMSNSLPSNRAPPLLSDIGLENVDTSQRTSRSTMPPTRRSEFADIAADEARQDRVTADEDTCRRWRSVHSESTATSENYRLQKLSQNIDRSASMGYAGASSKFCATELQRSPSIQQSDSEFSEDEDNEVVDGVEWFSDYDPDELLQAR